MRVALIGCGTIGSAIALAIAEGQVPGVELVAIGDVVETDLVRRTAAQVGCPFTTDVLSILDGQPDLVVEAASQAAVRAFAAQVLEAGFDLMVVSVGALADAELLNRLIDLARQHGRRLHVPSGAIGGLDILKAAAVGGIDEVRLTTTKPPKALAGAPYVEQQGIDLGAIAAPTVLYEGPASEAVRAFPQNVNVAASVSLAGIGPERTLVRVVADPQATQNIHELFVRGAFGEATVRLVNFPSPTNPKTSYLASLSAIAALRQLGQPFQLGT
ncbi:MAG: aspartate dehydrogenase [Chloroflexi bacterium]|nr:aspartate dehydrogenase [Chloroflexota bacterium]